VDPEKTGITTMLTQLQITSAKPKAKPYNLSDGQGLVLAIQATGSKLWRFRYRYGGLQKTLHLGRWPIVSLADAREKCREARKAIAAGLDPALEKKRAKVAAQFAVATTFKEVALEWTAKCEREGRADVTLDKIRWLPTRLPQSSSMNTMRSIVSFAPATSARCTTLSNSIPPIERRA
jgi:hypothetical protein